MSCDFTARLTIPAIPAAQELKMTITQAINEIIDRSQKMNDTILPVGLTKESAYYALDGTIEQKRAKLADIVAACKDFGTAEAVALGEEAAEYLAEIAAWMTEA